SKSSSWPWVAGSTSSRSTKPAIAKRRVLFTKKRGRCTIRSRRQRSTRSLRQSRQSKRAPRFSVRERSVREQALARMDSRRLKIYVHFVQRGAVNLRYAALVNPELIADFAHGLAADII